MMRLQKATPELINSKIISEVIPDEERGLLIQKLSEGAKMNIIMFADNPVGFVILINGELMTVIHQDYRKKGYVYKACIETVNECFEDTDIKSITIKTVTNSPSYLLAKKLGFSNEEITDNLIHPESKLALTKNAWESLPQFHLSDAEINLIREACFELASVLKWSMEKGVEEVSSRMNAVSQMTEKIYDTTITVLMNNKSLGCNAGMIIRAVNYIRDVHASPISHDDPWWYEITLVTLIELVCPNYEIDTDDEIDFIKIDVRKRLGLE